MNARLAARVRIPAMAAGALLILLGPTLGVPGAAIPGLALLVTGLALYFRVGTVRAQPIAVRAPVRGRWSALNSPADKVPSHGLHAYGQTYGIDFVHMPGGGAYKPELGWWPATRAPAEYPGFDRPVVAPADGTVVRVHARERDHRSRSSWPGLALWIVEGFFRELTGPDRILGNHVVIEVAPGAYAVVAHLRRRSAKVRPGDRVRAGDEIAACGNSGSSTEPHVHFQLMDRPRALLAAGLPFRLTGAADDHGDPAPLPATGDVIVA
jgi:murein DD-endopeptidase MepM/ murein hydrolase activator NlpD